MLKLLIKIDFSYFNNIIPSVQPTHATSDMYWAEDKNWIRKNKRCLCV